MNAKINVCSIIKGHIKTLYNANSKKLSWNDIFTFYVFPVGIAALCCFIGLCLDDNIISLLINFGSIFTALLLSVLVLVYDQVSKITDKLKDDKNNAMLKLKYQLLHDLYFNISYSMILSLLLIVLCLIYSMLEGIVLIGINFNQFLFLPLIIFVTINQLLTILMIIKRLHVLLVSKH